MIANGKIITPLNGGAWLTGTGEFAKKQAAYTPSPEMQAWRKEREEQMAREAQRKEEQRAAENEIRRANFTPTVTKYYVDEYTSCCVMVCCCIPLPAWNKRTLGYPENPEGHPIKELPGEGEGSKNCCCYSPVWGCCCNKLPDTYVSACCGCYGDKQDYLWGYNCVFFRTRSYAVEVNADKFRPKQS